MNQKPLLRSRWQSGVQLFFFLFFIFAAVQGRPQLWLLVFVVGVGISLFWGRFYCSWVCPMNALFTPINWLEKRFGRWRRPLPPLLRQPWLVAPVLVIMLVVQRSPLPLSPFLAALLMSMAVSSIFDERLWHRYLCPYGAVLALPAGRARRSSKIAVEECIGCGLCEKVCPTVTIEAAEDGRRSIDPGHCLQCFHCHDVCPPRCISYGRMGQKREAERLTA